MITGKEGVKRLVAGLEPSAELLAIAMGTAHAARPVGLILACGVEQGECNNYLCGCTVCAVYFVQGILGLSRLGVTFMYKDEFGLDPASVRSLLRCP